MSSNDKLDILKQMVVLVGQGVLRGEERAQLDLLSAAYDEAAAKKPTRRKTKGPEEPLPDVHEAFASRSKGDFLTWASGLELSTLKRIVKAEQLDPAGRSLKWRKADKFAEMIYEQLDIRAERGAGFGRIGNN